MYYRCIITNNNGTTASAITDPAVIIVEPELNPKPTDLTGTRWLIDADAYDYSVEPYSYQITFMSGGTLYRWLYIGGDMIWYCPKNYPSTSGEILAYDLADIGWNFEHHRTIEITGGSDATNQNLIEWLWDKALLIE